MKHLVWLFKFLLKAAIFFTLFAFALNNQGDVTLHFFFGTRWSGPLVLVVLATFALGVMVGVLGMVPRWWRHRRLAKQLQQTTQQAAQATAPTTDTPPVHGI